MPIAQVEANTPDVTHISKYNKRYVRLGVGEKVESRRWLDTNLRLHVLLTTRNFH